MLVYQRVTIFWWGYKPTYNWRDPILQVAFLWFFPCVFLMGKSSVNGVDRGRVTFGYPWSPRIYFRGTRMCGRPMTWYDSAVCKSSSVFGSSSLASSVSLASCHRQFFSEGKSHMGTSQKILETYAKKTSLKHVCFRKICQTWWISLTSR